MKRFANIACALLVVALVVVNTAMVPATTSMHRWWQWHWHRSNLNVWVYGSHVTQTRAAMADWSNNTDINLTEVTSHNHISAWGQNFGDTGWGGLASIESSSWDWHCWWWCEVTHAHARFNSFYSGTNNWWAQGVQCQEIGHTFGLDHDNTGGCMGLGYWAGQGNTSSAHSRGDINAMY
jgi:hypothetical protein